MRLIRVIVQFEFVTNLRLAEGGPACLPLGRLGVSGSFTTKGKSTKKKTKKNTSICCQSTGGTKGMKILFDYDYAL